MNGCAYKPFPPLLSMAQSITHHRLSRLALGECLLGEPDLISIRQTKVSSNFFKHEKRIEDYQENYINGLIFPTTAHFSSFISTRYRAKDPSKLTVRAKLFMFDAFGERDLQIEVNIPGSMEVTSFNLKGEQVRFEKQDYQGAYFSSFLRSLHPMNYPNIILYPLLSRVELLKSIIKNFVPFTYKHDLRDLGYEFDLYRRQRDPDEPHNLAIEILIDYCVENHFGNLLEALLQELKKHSLPKYHQAEFKLKLMQKKYPEIICRTAEKLLLHGNATHLKERQIEALFPLGKYQEIAYIGKSLLQSGGTSRTVSYYILISLIQIGEDVRFLKSLNLVNNLLIPGEKKIRQVSHKDNNKGNLQLQNYTQRGSAISECPQLCFPFDNHFYNRLVQYKNHQNLLRKNSKEGFTIAMLDSIEASLADNPPFYDILIKYEKQRGWKTLMKFRGDCFWLESDFHRNEEMVRVSTKDFDNSSFFQQKFEETEEEPVEESSAERPEETEEGERENERQKQRQQQKKGESEGQGESFDGNLSEHQQQKQSFYLPKCSAKISSKKPLQYHYHSKILCGLQQQKLFMMLYNDYKLQNSLDVWQMKVRETNSQDFTNAKRELAAMIFLKKGLLHRKMQRGKKCEEALKMARKLSSSPALNLVAVYQLLLLYIDSKNTKGVEFYLIELLKLLKTLGVQNFDIVPQWAKPVIQYILSHEGLSIVKNIHPVFKAVFAIFLRANFLQQQVESIVQHKKDK